MFNRQHAHRLLKELLELPAEQREAALAAGCGGDADLRDAVARLLQAAESPDPVLDIDQPWCRSLWQEFTRETFQREHDMCGGTRIGPYQVLDEIGRGGMAVVYRARRVDGELDREVAIKLLRLGLDTEEVVRRFEQERQILADLDHPNIARLYDAGRTGDGRPFFVMEQVRGQPIDQYCDRRRLSIEDRLKLFCVVSEAVEYAHQNLVVHRDLKPSNILVNQAGEVKLLDFGIARMLDVQAADQVAAPPTQAFMRMMTPEYASPEQIRGERVTTASDVYQLGLLLYELLTGHRPYRLSGSSPGELERVICGQPPTRLSVAVSRLDTIKYSSPDAAQPATADSLSALCRARRLSPARLRRRLRGDLERIGLQALDKEPERRYRSADRLAQDIRRHLGGLPVTARAGTWTYRGRKFVQRHPLGAGLTIAALILAAGLTGFHTVRIQNERDLAQAERAQAQTERSRAEAEAAKAEQISRFLSDLFWAANPLEARGAELTARELLDRGMARIDHELASQPEVQADLQRVLGRTYLDLGVYDAAERLLNRALDTYEQRPDQHHTETAAVLMGLGRLRRLASEYEEARALMERALERLDAAPADDPMLRTEILTALGSFLFQDFQEVELGRAILEQAWRIQADISGDQSVSAARVLHRLGNVLFGIGALNEAADIYLGILATHEREGISDHPDAGTALVSLAFIRLEQGRLDGLEDMYRRGLAILEAAYGPRHPVVAVALSNLSHLLVKSGRPDEAVALAERAVAIRSAAIGDGNPDIGFPLTTLGDAHFAAGRPLEARQYYRRSLELRARPQELSGFDGLVVHNLVRLGQIGIALNEEAEARDHLELAVRLWHTAPEYTDPRSLPTLLALSHWLAAQDRCADARPLLLRLNHLLAARPGATAEERSEAGTLMQRCGTGT